MMQTSTLDRAHGRWREILPQLGIDSRFLRNKHGPCPICGGKDRFRFDDKLGQGNYYCGQCGAGTGFTMLRKLLGQPSGEILKAIDEIIGKEYRPPPPKPDTIRTDVARRATINRLLGESGAQHIVDGYLMRRGLSVTSPVLKGHPACPYFDEEGQLVGRFPTVLAPILAPDGELMSVQRVYVADVPERKKTMAPVRTIKGGAVRLQKPTDELGVCEGFETGLAAHELFGVPVWATLAANNLEIFNPPHGIRQLHVFADNDVTSEGQAAAFNLARRVNRWNRQHRVDALPVLVHLPPTVGADWLDVLNNRQPA